MQIEGEKKTKKQKRGLCGIYVYKSLILAF